jgi:hypothetical protein
MPSTWTQHIKMRTLAYMDASTGIRSRNPTVQVIHDRKRRLWSALPALHFSLLVFYHY